nr:glycosyltransferase [Hydrogenophaga aromaticivorans]
MLSSKHRKPTVFHVSHLAQQRKNVRLLIEVAIKRDFNLRLAGSLSDPDFAAWLMKIVEEHPNIAYLGRISDEELMEELLSCSVFCLPSLYEGVGLVALDAGYCGANLAITSAGGTRDYLGSQAIFFDPRDSEALGDAISESLAQPLPNIDAHLHVAGQFSKQATGRKLEAAYVGLLG